MNKEELILVLEKRFKDNMNRHPNIEWNDIIKRLNDNILKSISYMEETKGEPDLIIYKDKYIYCDTSKESPLGRRSMCYDEEALNKRKTNKPLSSALKECNIHNIDILTEEEYIYLQTLGDFDTKSTSWLYTPIDIRNLGGSIFGNKSYNRTFIYHNSAESYYSNRGFRAKIEI